MSGTRASSVGARAAAWDRPEGKRGATPVPHHANAHRVGPVRRRRGDHRVDRLPAEVVWAPGDANVLPMATAVCGEERGDVGGRIDARAGHRGDGGGVVPLDGLDEGPD